MRFKLLTVLVLVFFLAGSAFANKQEAKKDGWWIKVSTQKPASQMIGFYVGASGKLLRLLECLESRQSCGIRRFRRISKQPDALHPCANDQRPKKRILSDVQIQRRQIFRIRSRRRPGSETVGRRQEVQVALGIGSAGQRILTARQRATDAESSTASTNSTIRPPRQFGRKCLPISIGPVVTGSFVLS